MSTTTNHSSQLLDKTIKLLQETKKSYLNIYMETGLKPNWLTMVATGKINDPSVKKIEKLYNYLSKKSLTV